MTKKTMCLHTLSPSPQNEAKNSVNYEGQRNQGNAGACTDEVTIFFYLLFEPNSLLYFIHINFLQTGQN